MAIGLGAAGGGKHNQPLSRILSDVRFGSKADIEHVRKQTLELSRSFGPLGRAPDETGHRPAEAESCREARENCRVITFVFSPAPC